MGDFASDERVLRHPASPVGHRGGASAELGVERFDRDATPMRVGDGTGEARRIDFGRTRGERSF